MIHQPMIQRSPDAEQTGDTRSKYDPENSESLKQTRHNESAITSSPEETPYVGSHADNYAPEQEPDNLTPKDGPSGENTKNGGERGGGLWTSGGQVTTGTLYHDEDAETA